MSLHLGLKTLAGDSPQGVLVVRAYAQYPFARAGVRDEDRILEFGHRPVGSLQEIVGRLLDFEPGTEIPLRIERGDATLTLTLTVE